jgi:hypothetical protein
LRLFNTRGLTISVTNSDLPGHWDTVPLGQRVSKHKKRVTLL